MNKSDLINAVAKDTGLTKADSEKALNSILENIKKGTKKDGSVQLVGFGTFKKVKRSARTGRNPQTGKVLKIPAKNVVKFSAGKKFKEEVK